MSVIGDLVVRVGADVTGLQSGMASASSAVSSAGAGMMRVGGALSLGVSAPLLAIGTSAISAASTFQGSMNTFQAVTGATGQEMSQLQATAMALGADITLPGTSAADAAISMTELARAGLSVNDTFAAAEGVLRMSAAAQISNEEAATITAAALNAFGLSGTEAVRVADLLAAGANASAADVTDMAASMQMSASVASMAGIPIEDLTTSIGMMANAGIVGSDAGTSLKTMMMALMSPTSQAAGLMSDLGISVYDSSGTMLPMRDIVGQVSGALGGLSQEQRNASLATIFGTDAVRAANIVLAAGTGAFDEMSTAVNRQGAATDLSAVKMSGLGGAFEAFKSTVETVLLQAALPFIGSLEQLVRKGGDFIESLGSMNPQILNAAIAIGAVLAVAGPVLLALGGLVMVVGALISPIGLVVLGITALAAAFATGAISIDTVRPILDGVQTGFNTLRQVAETVLASIQTFWATHGAEIMASAEATWNTIQGVVTTVVNAVSSVVQEVLGVVQTFLANHGAEIESFIVTAWTGIQTIIQTSLAIIEGVVEPILTGIANFIQTHGDDIQRVLSAAWSAIEGIVTIAITAVQGILSTVLALIHGDWEGAWNALKTAGETIWNTIKSTISDIAESLGPVLENIWSSIRTTAETAWNNIKGAVATIVGNIKTAVETKVNEIVTVIETWLTNTLNTIQNFDLGAAARALFGKVVTGILEKVGDALSAVAGFLDDAFLAIESFDLRGAAETFFGTTIPGIVAKAGEALGKVTTWVGDVFSRIQEKDLKPAATSFFSTVIPGIVAKAGEALEQIVTWLGNVAQRISEFDLMAAAKTLFGTIIPGLVTKVGEAIDEVVAWLDDVAATISNKTFESDTMTAIQTVVAGIVGTVSDILTAISNLLTDISTKISEFSLFDAGANLISGFINGIGSMVGGAIAAAADVVQQAIAAAWAAVQPGSPSKVGTAIGANLVEGMVFGVAGMAGALVDAMSSALGDVSLAALERGAEIADAVGSIVDTMTSLIDAAGALAAFQVPDGLSAAIDAIAGEISYVIVVFLATVAQFEADAVSAAADFADSASSVLDVFSAGVDLVTALADYTEVNIGPAAASLATNIGILTSELARVASQIGPEALAAAAASGALFEQAMAPWQAGIDVVAAMATYTQVVIGPAASALADQMMGLARHLARVATQIGPEALAAAAAAGALFQQAMAPWQAGIDVVAAMAAHTEVVIGPAARALADQMMGLARHLNRVATEIGPEALASAATAAGQLETVVGVWAPAIDALEVLGGHVPSVIGPTAQIIVDQIRGLASKFRLLQTDLADLGNLAAFTGQVQTFVGHIIDVVQSMNDLSTAAGEPINLFPSGYQTGYDWVRGIVAGLNNRLPDLVSLMAYIRGLFPSSPAKYGPFRTLPDGGPVGSMFARDLAGGVDTGKASLERSMKGLYAGMVRPPAFSNALGGQLGLMTPSASTGSAGGPVTINVYNPKREASEESLRREMRYLAAGIW